MATDFDLDCVEQIFMRFGYTFTGTNRQLLRQSLVAAGSEEENHDGNRRLARVGESLIGLVVIQGGYEMLLSRADLNMAQNKIGSKDWCTAVADKTGITACIKVCERSGLPSKTVKRYAINAIIGAIWKDSGETLKVVTRVLISIDHFITHTPHLSGGTMMSSLFERREWHEISLPSDVQICSVPFEPYADSPSQLLTDQGSIETEQRNDNRLGDVNSLDPFRGEPADVERSGSTLEAFRTTPQSNTSLLNASIMEEHSSGGSTTLEHAAAPRPIDTAFTNLADIEWFRTYVIEDGQRYAEYNLPNPWLAPTAQTVMRKLAEFSERNRTILLKLWVGVCSPFSVVSLQDTMQAHRSDMRAELLSPKSDLSVSVRLRIIESAEKCVAGLLLVRRLHVLQLLEDEPCAVNGGAWINVSMSTESTKTRRPGNPLNVQESAVTKSLLQRFYPHLSPSSEEYRRVYEKLKRLRRLGRRFQMLAMTFGIGILGLLPCSEFSFQGFNLAVSDHALLSPTDNEFSRFLTLLDSSEGDMLRRFSCAAAPIVNGIFAGDMGSIDRYPLQQLEVEEIRRLPRCSELLLASFSGDLSVQLQAGSSGAS